MQNSLTSLNIVSVSNLKVYRDMLEEITEMFDKARTDMTYRIADLQKQVAKEQSEKFKNSYFSKEAKENKEIENNKFQSDHKKNKDCSKPEWCKKIYKKIVLKSHPDKNIKNPHKDETDLYKKIYKDTVKIYESGEYLYLLSNAYTINIPLDIMTPELKAAVDTRVKEIIKKIDDIKNTNYWLWIAFTDSQKTDYLKQYFKHAGYDISSQSVMETLRKKPERKTGTRPAQSIRNRNL